MPIVNRALSLADLPAPPEGKTDWPWTEQSELLGDRMPDGSEWPRISIVTPSYNQGEFIEETILSVINQDYPNLEYIILDNCSTDKTGSILEKYQDQISKIIVEPDEGSGHAINKGMQIANGDWFNWLNSDDILLPNSLFLLADVIKANPYYSWISGGKINLDEQGKYVSSQAPWRDDISFWLYGDALFSQDATFIRLDLLREHQILLNEDFKNLYDTDLYLRLLQISQPLLTTAVFSGMRWHPMQKTANNQQREKESAAIQSEFSKLPHSRAYRTARRLCSTRFNTFGKLFFLWMAYLHLWPSRLDWPCYVYDPWHQTFELTKVGEVIL